jgi:hypothetical protein
MKVCNFFFLLILLYLGFGLASAQEIVYQNSSTPSTVLGNAKYIPARGGAFLPSQGTIRALAVFVQFKNDNNQDVDWRLGELPNWSYDFAAAVRGYFDSMSKGKLNLIIDLYPKLMNTSKTEEEYVSLKQNYGDVNKEVLTRISNNFDFRPYDSWALKSRYDVVKGSDGQIDIIMIVFRDVSNSRILSFGGTSDLGFPYFIYVDSGARYIYGGNGQTGLPFDPSSSGITVCRNPGSGLVTDRYSAVRLALHEFSHKILGEAHFTVNWALLGLMSDHGGGAGMHSFERRLLGYIDYIIPSDGRDTAVILRDYMSTGDACLIRVPGVENQYYVLENRQQSSPYDEAMGKGLYVYLLTYDGQYDYVSIETADGKWDWEVNASTIRKKKANPVSGYSHLERVTINGVAYYPPDYYGNISDPFNVGYNYVCAPYTNPNSNAVSMEGQTIFTGVAIKAIAQTREGIVVTIAYNVQPIPPTGLLISGSSSHVTLQWNAASEVNIVGYKIYRGWSDDTGKTPMKNLSEVGFSSTPTYRDTGLLASRQRRVHPSLFYCVRAVNDKQQLSDASDCVYLKQPARTYLLTNDSLSPTNRQTPEASKALESESMPQFWNYPNPFNPVTTIAYQLSSNNHVSLRVYNVLGQEVAHLVEGSCSAGMHAAEFNANHLAAGIYLCRISVEGNHSTFVATRRMQLVK